MAETVLVSLHGMGIDGDYELPARLPLRDLYPRLFHALRYENSTACKNCSGIILEQNGRGLLLEAVTLLDYGIRSGSTLEIVGKEKYDGFSGR